MSKKNKAPCFSTDEGMLTYWKKRLHLAKQMKTADREEMILMAEKEILKYRGNNP
jgi:hypothetical protein